MSTGNTTQDITLNQHASTSPAEVDIMSMTWCQADDAGLVDEYEAAHDIGDEARAALLKLIQDRNADLLETVTSDSMYPRSANELKALEARCNADWQRYLSGVQALIQCSSHGGAGPFWRHMAAWAIANKPFGCEFTCVGLPCTDWAQVSALAAWLSPSPRAEGNVAGLRDKEETLVRYFYAFSGREQPDLANLREEELYEVLNDVRYIIEREWALDMAKLVERSNERLRGLFSIGVLALHFRKIQEMRRPWLARFSEEALRCAADLLLLPVRLAWHAIDALRNRGKSKAD